MLLILGYPMRIELMIAESQPAVLPLNYGHHIETHSGIRTLRPASGLQTDPLAIGNECVSIW